MSRQISAALQTHIGQEVTSLTTCWAITRRDGVVVRLTDHDADVTITGDGTYLADAGFSRTAIEIQEGLRSDTSEVEGFLSDNGVDAESIRRGLYEGAAIRVFAVNWQSPDDGTIQLRAGRLGEIVIGQSNRFQAELRSLSDLLNQKFGEVYSATCRADVGDDRSKFPIEPPVLQREQKVAVGEFYRVAVAPGTLSEIYGNLIFEVTVAGITSDTEPVYNATVDATTADGTATLKAYESWTRHGSILENPTDGKTFTINVTENRAVTGWFDYGMITFESGPNAGLTRSIKSFTAVDGSDDIVELHLPFPDPPQIGNAFRIFPGSDKTAATTISKFRIPGSVNFNDGNILNFRGEQYLPGRDAVFSYPDAQ